MIPCWYYWNDWCLFYVFMSSQLLCLSSLLFTLQTNHLDLETTEALIEAIQSFKGSVLLVSHDQHLLTNVCKDLYVVENGKVDKLRGGMSNVEAFEAYKKAVVQGRR